MVLARLSWILALLLSVVLCACGDDQRDTPADGGDADIVGDGVDDGGDGPDQADPCVALVPCASEVARCDGDTLVECVTGAAGCSFEATTDCAASGLVCDVADGSPACTDPCEAVSTCAVAGRSCDATSLVVCSPDANGCLVAETTNCTTVGGANTCMDGSEPIACGFDPCAGEAGCAAQEGRCDGDLLTQCVADGFGCLSQTVTDCAALPGGTCDPSVGRCTASTPCDDACTEGALCDGNLLITCRPDASGCLAEERYDCSGTPNGYCDATGGPACTIDDTDRCAGKTLCTGSVERTTCAGGGTHELRTCAFDPVGCLVQTSVDCASVAGEGCLEDPDGHRCGRLCTDHPLCVGRADGDALCVDNALYVCADSDADGCLEADVTDCLLEVCDPLTASCTPNGSGDSCADPITAVENGRLVAGRPVFVDFSDALSLTDPSCAAATDSAVEAVFRVPLSGGQTVYAQETGDFPAAIHITSTCGSNPVCLLSEDEGTGAKSYTASADETVFVVFEAQKPLLSDNELAYAFTVEVDPVCGNGLVEITTEACDHANNNPGDGCAADCTVEHGWACDNSVGISICTPFPHLGTFRVGDPIPDTVGGPVPAGGSDNYTVTFLELSKLSGSLTGFATGEADLRLIDESGAVVFAAQSFGQESWTDALIPAGTYVIEVQALPGVGDVDAYTLAMVTRGFACGDGAVEGMEACDDQNTVDGDGCASDCTVEAGRSCFGQPSVCYLGTGSSCSSPVLISGSLTILEGDLFAMGDAHDFSDPSCIATASGAPEMVMEMTLQPGEYVYCSEQSPIDGVLSIMKACSDMAVCEHATDQDETTGALYANTSTSAETVYCVFSKWSSAPTSEPFDIQVDIYSATCNDGFMEGGEQCEDGNTADGDGCSSTCLVEPGWLCEGAIPNLCHHVVCGDDTAEGGEGCDDGNTAPGDGCSSSCVVESGWLCDAGIPNACHEVTCNDGVVEGTEECEDGNVTDGDGCSSSCGVETGWTCDASTPSSCHLVVCGDGLVDSGEGCDDGDTIAGDGCGSACQVESGHACSGAPSSCAVAAAGEVCDTAFDASAKGIFLGTTVGASNDYDPTANGCTGWEALGPDVVYTLTLADGHTLDATVTPVGWDASLYILTDCSDPLGSCVGGDDNDFGAGAESLRYTNRTGAALELYIVIDGYSESGDYSLEVTVAP